MYSKLLVTKDTLSPKSDGSQKFIKMSANSIIRRIHGANNLKNIGNQQKRHTW